MIVDLLRNDLSRVAKLGTVTVPELFVLERYDTVWQLTSTVRARTRPGIDLVDLLAATFPCGSITGAPKTAAMRIIERLEPDPRGVYCGAIGMLAPPGEGDRATFSVAIRTAVIDRRSERLTYGAGGGITWGSDPIAEDAEAEAKARVLREPRPTFELLETLRVADGAALRLDAHLARLARAAAWFGFVHDDRSTRAAVTAALAGERGERLRILLRRDGRVRCELGPLPAAASPVRLAVATRPFRTDDPFARYKTTNRQAYDRARAEAPGVDDVILVNERDEVIETTIANLLFRRDGRWFTPPVASGGLDGIGRRALIDDGQVSERVLPLCELGSCDALAVVSSLRGVRRAYRAPGIDDRQCQADETHGVDADDVRAAHGRQAACSDRGRIPFLELGRPAQRARGNVCATARRGSVGRGWRARRSARAGRDCRRPTCRIRCPGRPPIGRRPLRRPSPER